MVDTKIHETVLAGNVQFQCSVLVLIISSQWEIQGGDRATASLGPALLSGCKGRGRSELQMVFNAIEDQFATALRQDPLEELAQLFRPSWIFNFFEGCSRRVRRDREEKVSMLPPSPI